MGRPLIVSRLDLKRASRPMVSVTMTDQLTIAEVQRRTGLPASTLRYYEREGLLDPPERTDSGRRSYATDDLAWIEFLCRLRATGMPIRQMRRFADLRRGGAQTVAARLTLLEEHRQAVDDQMRELRRALRAIDQKIITYREDGHQ